MPTPELYEIYDARQPTRTSGPYEDEAAAQDAADKLNSYIFKNQFPALAALAPNAKVTGPYYPRLYRGEARGKVAVFNGGSDPRLERPKVFGA